MSVDFTPLILMIAALGVAGLLTVVALTVGRRFRNPRSRDSGRLPD